MGTVPGQQGSDVPPGAAPLDVSEEGDEEKIKPVNFKELAQDGRRDTSAADGSSLSAKSRVQLIELDKQYITRNPRTRVRFKNYPSAIEARTVRFTEARDADGRLFRNETLDVSVLEPF